MNLLKVENLTVKLGNNKIIDDLTFVLTDADTLGILIPNSGGKTTLIRTLSGVIAGNGGKINVNNVPLTRRYLKKYIVNIGTVFEDIDNQFLSDTVKDELKFPLIHLCYKKRIIDDRVDIVSKVVKIDNILDKSIDKLSNMEKIKVLIASSIMHFPKVLLLDDIFRTLNKKDRKEIFNVLNSIKSNFSIAIVYTTSDIDDVIDINNVVVISEGRCKLKGTFNDIIKQDNELSKMGFEIPLMIDLSRKLQFYDLIDDIYYDVDKVVDKLWK